MRLKIKTQVAQDLNDVLTGFDERLFLKLAPPFPPVKLLRFDGSRKGDTVTLELNFFFFKQQWTSYIVDHKDTTATYQFIDQGVKLPFFLKKWRHTHILERNEQGTCIIDNISYAAPYRWLTPLLYPVLFLQFWYRKPIYRKVFGAKV